MAGMSDLGGVKFFNLAVETPAGDVELLEKVLEGGSGLTISSQLVPSLESLTA